MPNERGVRKSWEREQLTMPYTEGLASRTKQSFKDQCDVNFIVSQFQRTGTITHRAAGRPQYADVSEAGSLLESIEAVEQAASDFLDLPSGVRAAAGNDPVTFLEMTATKGGMDYLVEAGLYQEREPEGVGPRLKAEKIEPEGPTREDDTPE